jgi:ATP-dependent Clp protease ATP-binding subunit ClpX
MWRFNRQQAKDRHCHFCGKQPNEVPCLVAGPRVFICDGCTQIAADLVVQYLSEKALRLKEAADKIPNQDEYSEDKK